MAEENANTEGKAEGTAAAANQQNETAKSENNSVDANR